MIEGSGQEGWLSGIRKELHAKTYRAQPVQRAKIPKPGGGERPLGIPTIRDRVVQTAAKLVVEPIFEADLEPTTYGYRPGRSAAGAIQEVNRCLDRGYTDVVDADLSKYFDRVNHDVLMARVGRKVGDKRVLALIGRYPRVGVMAGGVETQRRQGTPQGGPLSPLLSNILLDDLDKEGAHEKPMRQVADEM